MTQENLLPPPSAIRVGLIGRAASAGPAGAVLERLRALVPAGAACRLVRAEAATAPAGWDEFVVAGLPAPATPGELSLDGDPAAATAADRAAALVIARHCDVLVIQGDPADYEEAIGDALGFGAVALVVGADVRLLATRHWQVMRTPLVGEAAWGRVAAVASAMLAAPELPDSAVHLRAGQRPRPSVIWRVHRGAMNLLWRAPAGSGGVSAGAPTAYWLGLHSASDALAGDFADRYRSSYVMVLGLAAVALAAAVVGDANLTPKVATAMVELLSLAAIAALVAANEWWGWRKRLIAYRLLSELCRKQSALSLVGRSLPASRIARMTQGGEFAWVGWCFASYARGAPFPAGSLAGEALARGRDAAAEVLLRGQGAYHEARVAAGRMRERRLVRLGKFAFAMTAVCVLAKLGLLLAGSEAAESAGVLAALLPVVAAAFFGLRAYAEFELLVRQSERTIATITEAERQLADMDVSRPLASVAVGDVLEATAVEMLGEVEGWMELSSVKAVEAG